MSRKTFFLAAIAVAASLDGLSAASAEPRVIDGFSMPESVLCRDGRCYVSNVGVALEPLKKDGDGFISLLDGDGRVLDRHAFPPKGETLDAPKGMALAGGRLFVADIDRVVGFDLATGARVFEARLDDGKTGAVLLNDLAAETDHALLVTDTLGNAVYRLSLESGTFSVIARVPGANGIVIDRDAPRATVVGVGENFSGGDVFAIDLTGKEKPRVLAERHGILDGIGQLADGDFVISDWTGLGKPVPGRFERVTQAGTVVPMPIGDVAIHGPADFDLDPQTGTVWIPAMLDGQVVVVDLGGASDAR